MKTGSRMDRSVRLYPLARKAASLHPVGKAWLETRDLPAAPKESFRQWWRRERKNQAPEDNPPPLRPSTRRASESASLAQGSQEDLLRTFEQRLLELGPEGTTELHVFERALVAEEFLRIRCEGHPPDRVAVQGRTTEKREYALGITRAELLIAETGGLVIDMASRAEGRPIMLAETHIVVARPSQLVPTVAHAMVTRSIKRKSRAWGDYQVVVTGPSRTADVEKVLVIPAHGPKRLVVVLCEELVDLGAVVPGGL